VSQPNARGTLLLELTGATPPYRRRPPIWFDRYELTCRTFVTRVVQADEVASALFDIFTTIGAPVILQTDNGKEFEWFKRFKRVPISDDTMDAIVKKIFEMWPKCVCVRGRPRHSQSNGMYPTHAPPSRHACK
jgi:hypothetical protein